MPLMKRKREATKWQTKDLLEDSHFDEDEGGTSLERARSLWFSVGGGCQIAHPLLNLPELTEFPKTHRGHILYSSSRYVGLTSVLQSLIGPIYSQSGAE